MFRPTKVPMSNFLIHFKMAQKIAPAKTASSNCFTCRTFATADKSAAVAFPMAVIITKDQQNLEAKNPPSQQKMTLEQEQLLEKDEGKQPSLHGLYKLSTFNHLLSRLTINRHFQPELRMMLIRSAAKLYSDCANNYNFLALHKEFGLEDNFFSWYRLTLLHLWMMLVRLQQCMEAAAFCFYRRQMTMSFHKDKTDRYNLVYARDKFAKTKRRSKFMELYYDVFMSSLFEYDEGFLANDQHLAGAVWRSFYLLDERVDIIHLNRVVRYIRQTLHFLDGLELSDLLQNGLERWAPAEQIVEEQRSRIY